VSPESENFRREVNKVMIRMGRSSRQEPNETSYGEQPANASPSPYASEGVQGGSRAISESESMARDIKEGRLSGFVGNGTVLTGETEFQAMLRVDGHLTGKVSSDTGTLIIGSTGLVDANVAVSSALINGTVNGDIYASDKVQLGRTACVTGNIQTPRLIMEDGAILEGACSMIKSRDMLEKQHAQAQSQYRTAELAPVTETAATEPEGVAEYMAADDEDEEAAGAAAN
jgi:cytoskeletal protein CcmA (bactofilin family)